MNKVTWQSVNAAAYKLGGVRVIHDMLTGREVEPSEGTITVQAGITITDTKGIRYMICSIAYGETKVMQYDEYVKRMKD